MLQQSRHEAVQSCLMTADMQDTLLQGQANAEASQPSAPALSPEQYHIALGGAAVLGVVVLASIVNKFRKGRKASGGSLPDTLRCEDLSQ